MTLIKYNPTKELLNMEREFNRLFNSFSKNFGFSKGNGDENSEYENAVWSPLADIYEDSDQYKLQLDLPGMEKKDVKISFVENELRISGERKLENEEKNHKFHRVERSFGKFYRSFTLPQKIKEDKISANFKDGQLVVTIPKSEDAKPKELEIKVN
ncbi:MAG: Hsp20/alpha crystallin family protein [Melioribacteraceae bacterium]|nr:Hsp20/alpha crystallin family protein [Melioribacteraceae bacterium]MCF8352973.1 Hsp20/alpha crystallin family protein [Melioribacteraceae bacterium]MCF8395356.1 Hsp20/alpha crystallin family protein [Melioribacteraceae bacterium]MCF8417842.1 Hsp20/alpha crystallin family protein [Melioribacteraceae bacterium]